MNDKDKTKQLKTKLEDMDEAAAMLNHAVGSWCERWEFGGSLRRRVPAPKDIEHIVIPLSGEVTTPGEMFDKFQNNLVCWALDILLDKGKIKKAEYPPTMRTRWGDKARSLIVTDPVGFENYRHEIYFATEDTWGVVMAIRTGPWQLSKHLVTKIKTRGYEVRDGNQVFPIGRSTPIPMKTEKEFFEICGVKWEEPNKRKEKPSGT